MIVKYFLCSRASNFDWREALDIKVSTWFAWSENFALLERFDETWILIEKIVLCAQTFEIKNCWRIFVSENVNEANGKHRRLEKQRNLPTKHNSRVFEHLKREEQTFLLTPWSFRRDWVSFAVSALLLTCVNNDSKTSLLSPFSLFRLSLHIHRKFSAASAAAIAPATSPCKENSTSG